ncbi:MAG: Hsp20/alpha crystallin family protein [Solirubrobacterales bacterium]
MYDLAFQPNPRMMQAPSILPRLDMLETADSVIYLFEIPGADPDHIGLEISRSEVVLSAPIMSISDYGEVTSIYMERNAGAYYRMAATPPGAEPDEVSAAYKNGILEVIFHKSDRRRAPRQPAAAKATKSAAPSKTAQSAPPSAVETGRSTRGKASSSRTAPAPRAAAAQPKTTRTRGNGGTPGTK